MKSKWLFAGGALCGFLLFAGCSSDLSRDTELTGPVYGKKDETTFALGSETGELKVRDVAVIAKTVRKYKRLNASESEIIRKVAELKLTGLVARQMEVLKPKYEAKKAAVRKHTAEKIAQVQKAAAVPAAVKQQEAQIQKAADAELAQLDLDWRKEASTAVAKTHGTDFAVPVDTPDKKAVVAFVSLQEEKVSVSADTYELAGISAAAVKVASSKGGKIDHSGRQYALLEPGRPVTVSAP